MYIHKLGTDEAYRISLKVFKQPDASKENMFGKSQMPEFISLKHVSWNQKVDKTKKEKGRHLKKQTLNMPK